MVSTLFAIESVLICSYRLLNLYTELVEIRNMNLTARRLTSLRVYVLGENRSSDRWRGKCIGKQCWFAQIYPHPRFVLRCSWISRHSAACFDSPHSPKTLSSHLKCEEIVISSRRFHFTNLIYNTSLHPPESSVFFATDIPRVPPPQCLLLQAQPAANASPTTAPQPPFSEWRLHCRTFLEKSRCRRFTKCLAKAVGTLSDFQTHVVT